jgi:hypothetical protein
MKHFKSALTLLLLPIALVITNLGMASSPSEPEMAAEAVVLKYFDALTQGDIPTVRALIGGDLLTKRSRLLDNPTYSTYLIDTFGSAHIDINNYKILDNGIISIEATIFLSSSPDDSMKKFFLLKKQENSATAQPPYIIFSEEATDN